MNKKSQTSKAVADKLGKTTRHKTRQTYSSKVNIPIVLRPFAARKPSRCCAAAWAIPRACITFGRRRFCEAGKRRRSGDTARPATSSEVKGLHSVALALKECVAVLILESRLLKKHDRGWGVREMMYLLPGRGNCELGEVVDGGVSERNFEHRHPNARLRVGRSARPVGGALRRETENGGQTGIRTLETVSRLHTFQACAFDHSATCPLRPSLAPAAPAVQAYSMARRSFRIFRFFYRPNPVMSAL